MKKELSVLVKGILAGIAISIGGAIFLALDNKVLGALLFSVGLFTVCTQGFNLYTGKVCYVFSNDAKYGLETIVIWIGNLIGCYLVSILLHLTRASNAMTEKAMGMCDVKLNDSLLSIFVLGMFCNILIYIAVEGYKNNPHEIGKYLAIIFGVVVFILCGFEHCVANMFYISMAKAWSGKAFVFIIVNTLGNAVGGVSLPLLKKLGEKLGK